MYVRLRKESSIIPFLAVRKLNGLRPLTTHVSFIFTLLFRRSLTHFLGDALGCFSYAIITGGLPVFTVKLLLLLLLLLLPLLLLLLTQMPMDLFGICQLCNLKHHYICHVTFCTRTALSLKLSPGFCRAGIQTSDDWLYSTYLRKFPVRLRTPCLTAVSLFSVSSREAGMIGCHLDLLCSWDLGTLALSNNMRILTTRRSTCQANSI